VKLVGGIPGEGNLLPAEKVHGPTTAVIAIMTFAMLLVAAAGLALTTTAGVVTKGVESRFVIELPAGIAGDLPKVLATVRSAPGVRSTTPVPETEMRSTLKDWLGSAAAAQDLPIPALVTVELKPGLKPTQLQARIAHDFPGATTVAETAELGPLLRSLHTLQWLALSIVMLVAVATSAAVVLAARGALDTHRFTIEIMHGIGATDRQVTRLFERKIATDALVGAVAGGLAAAIGLLLVGGAGAAFAGELTGAAPLGQLDLLILAILPILVVVLAILVARWAILKALRETL
jgi:cell division transport system permease protein